MGQDFGSKGADGLEDQTWAGVFDDMRMGEGEACDHVDKYLSNTLKYCNTTYHLYSIQMSGCKISTLRIKIQLKALCIGYICVEKLSTRIMNTVGERIKSLRVQAGLTQSDLAARVGLTYVQIGRYEKRGAVPSADVLSKLADALHTTTDFLMHGSLQDKASAQITDNELLSLFRSVEKMNNEDKSVIKTVIDALITKRQVQQLAQ
jgi:transcriptional regulator with XRE-family HTH domain